MTGPSFADRVVPFTTCFNVRDVGGWRTTDGRRVRWRTLYRGDTLHRLDEDEVATLAGLGLRTIVDLRSDRELEEHGRFRQGRAGRDVDHHHIPFVDEAGANSDPRRRPEAEAPRTLAEGYFAMATGARRSIGSAVRILAAPGGRPAMFHCTAGKDRTGVLAAIMLAAIGVVDDDIRADYELTAESREARQAWLAENDPAYYAFQQTLPPEALEVRGDAVQSMLDGLRADHGTIAGYLVSAGVTADEIDRLAAALLE